MQRRLHIVQALEKNRLVTGSVVQMAEAVRGLSRRGHRVTVVSRPGGDFEEICESCGAEFLPLALKDPFDLGSIRNLRSFFKTRFVHLVHAYKGRPHAIALFAAARLGPSPALVVNRGVSFPLTRCNRLKYRHPRVRAVVCVAESIRNQLVASANLDPKLVHTIASGTDIELFDPRQVDASAVRSELGLSERNQLIGTVSARQWKGWREVMRAVSMIAPGEPEVRLLVVGCEPESVRQQVLDEAINSGLSDRVLTLGFRSDMPEIYAACDVVVDASTEGTGITGTIREAMAMERPVVATDCGGNRSLVRDQENGLLVPAGDIEALGQAISALIWDSRLPRRLGPAARAGVLDGFTTEQRLDRLEELYAAILGLN